ncbi:MAG TPA: hypothetical protein VHQ47_11040 [Phycisphaerae bacterium]|nr:hypothetical protein [Phycisphaerae bacterium]
MTEEEGKEVAEEGAGGAETASVPENPEVTTAPAVAAIVTPGADGGVVQIVEEPGEETPQAEEERAAPPPRTSSIAMVLPAHQLFGG